MKPFRIVSFAMLIALVLALVWWRQTVVSNAGQAKSQANEIPVFEYDPTWPKALPNHWLLGNIGAMAIDSKDHIWIAQRPGSTTSLSERYGLTGEGECCVPAPPIMEFDQPGNLEQAWDPIHDAKGQLLGKQTWGPFPNVDWPLSEHGIFVDHRGNVWLDGQSPPSQLLKFTRDGKFLMRIGKEEAKSSNDTLNLAGPTGLVVDPATNEVYVADGYRNRRVIVFDAETGAYKRHWGAYGKRPLDGPLGGDPIEGKYDPKVRSQQFATVHCVTQSNDRMVYVCDRVNDRIHVFQMDGTFMQEALVAPQTGGFGSVHALGFSPDRDQRFLYVADGANKKVRILRRSDLKILGSFGRGGRAGGQLLIAHALVVDSKGNIYVGETIDNNRIQRFNFVGMRPISSN